MRAEPQPEAPRILGRYELLFRIAAGGMAEVHAARVIGEGGFQKLVAVKRMLPHLAADAKFVAMFLDEARLAANISSPHVVQTLELGRASDGSLYLVLELVRGCALSRLLYTVRSQDQQLPVPIAIELIAQAAQGLHDAHTATTPLGEELGIVHRDISPQNILVGIDGRARITDFGVARAVLRRTHTMTGELKGKLAYFAPEQASGDPIDHRADVFSLGVVAWETLAGRRLFAAENPLAQLERVTRMRIPMVDEIRAEVPRDVSKIVAWALERDLERRVPTAGEFARALRDAASRHMRLPDAGEVAAFVRRVAGDAIGKLDESLRRVLAEPVGAAHEPIADLSDLAVPVPDDDESGIVASGWQADLPSERTRIDHTPSLTRVRRDAVPETRELAELPPQPEFNAAPTLVTHSPDSSPSMPTPTGTEHIQRQKTAPRGLLIAGLLVGGALVIGAGVLLGMTMFDSPSEPELAPPIASPAEPAPPATPAAPPELEPADPEPALADPAMGAIDDSLDVGGGRSAAATDDEREPAETRRRSGRRSSRTGATGTSDQPRTETTQQGETASTSERATQRPQETSAQTAPERRRIGPNLVGLDSFERDLQRRP